MKFKALIASLAIAMSVNLSMAGSFEDGVAAHKRFDHRTALKFFKAMAQQGDATAQYDLGLMYSDGQGVPQEKSGRIPLLAIYLPAQQKTNPFEVG